MTTPVHAWLPSSPCGDGCLPTGDRRVGLLTTLLRALLAAAVVSTAPLLAACRLLPRSSRDRIHRGCARILLRCVGVRLEVIDRRDRRGYDGGVLVVAPHVSWIDVLVLAAVAPTRFVARADLLEWGVLGVLARKMHVIPIDRHRLRQLPAVVERIRLRLRDGERVTVFPEGTTWCGRAYGGFRPALLEAAVAAECPVQPVGLRYLDPAGALTTGPAFVGDETITSSLRRSIRSRGTVAEVVLAPLEWPGTDRRDLAARCARAARTDRVADDLHGVLAELPGVLAEPPGVPTERSGVLLERSATG